MRTAEIETRDIGTAVHLDVSKLNVIASVGNFLKDCIVVIKSVTVLVDISQLNCFTEFNRSLVWFFFANNHSEER